MNKFAGSSMLSLALKIKEQRQMNLTLFLYIAPSLELYITKSTNTLKRILERRRLEEFVLRDSGWWLTPSIMELPAITVDRAIQEYDNGNKRAITNLFMRVYQANQCHNLEVVVNNWYENKRFEVWQKHITPALIAHKNRAYELSIPMLLIVAEGIAGRYCRDYALKAPSNRGNEKIKEAITEASKTNGLLADYVVQIIFDQLDHVVYVDTRAPKPAKVFPSFINRHAIFHGWSRTYAQRKNSLKCFMLLDVLNIL